MSYESRLYIVDKTDNQFGDGGGKKKYGEVIAVFDMRKYYGFGDVFQKKTDCFIYGDDGNTEILVDGYGKELGEARISDVIDYVENIQKNERHYRRDRPLLNLLKAFDESDWDVLVVLHYGH